MTNNIGGQNSGFPDNWTSLSPEQKRQWRLDNFINGAGVDFISPEAKSKYQLRAKRIADVFSVREPDRVPVHIMPGNLPYTLNGISYRTAMYDYNQLVSSCRKFNEKYGDELECFSNPFMVFTGRIMDMLDYKLYTWPGHGLSLEAPGMQYVEGEYMTADEYDDFILNPSDFWFRKYLPRVFGAFAPFGLFQPATNIIENVSLSELSPLGDPAMQECLLKMVEFGREYKRMMQIIEPYGKMGPASGFPSLFSGMFAKAPFDTLGDTLRGTANIMKDMYRRPDKVLAACDKIADLTINSILKSPVQPKHIVVNYPLHKGADGWMSQKQFDTFYWPSLKKVMNAFIQQGLIQYMFAEGSFNTRLETVNEFPKGTVSWMLDQTDIFKAKKVLGDRCGIVGNVPSSLTVTGTPQDVKAYCRKLIEGVGQGGGYELGPGAGAENPKLENLLAMVEAAREFGIYKR